MYFQAALRANSPISLYHFWYSVISGYSYANISILSHSINTWYYDCHSSFCLPLDMMEGVLWFQESSASPFSRGPVSKATLHVCTCQNWQQYLQDAPRCTDRNITDKVNWSQVRSRENHHASIQNCEKKHIHKWKSLNGNTKRLIRHCKACHSPVNSE